MAKKKMRKGSKGKVRAVRPPVNIEALRSAEVTTVDQLCALQPAFTPGGVRWDIFCPGVELEKLGALVRVGRRVVLRPQRFLDFKLSHGQSMKAAA